MKSKDVVGMSLWTDILLKTKRTNNKPLVIWDCCNVLGGRNVLFANKRYYTMYTYPSYISVTDEYKKVGINDATYYPIYKLIQFKKQIRTKYTKYETKKTNTKHHSKLRKERFVK